MGAHHCAILAGLLLMSAAPQGNGVRVKRSVPVSNCPPLLPPPNGLLTCGGTQSEKSECTIGCKTGYHFDAQPPELYFCLESDGIWYPDQDYPNCVPDQIIITSTDLPAVGTFTETPAFCKVWGQDHHRTFDALYYSFNSGCRYTLMQDCVLDTFSIHVINHPDCYKTGSLCTREIDIFSGNDILSLRRDGNVTMATYNDVPKTVPCKDGAYIIEEISHYVVVKTSLGFTIWWDQESSIRIDPNDNLRNRTCGLCGTYTGTTNDDLASVGGFPAATVEDFAGSWLMADGQCDPDPDIDIDPCRHASTAVKAFAASKCGLIFSSEFRECADIIDATPYYKSCTWDYCKRDSTTDIHTQCDSFMAYVDECHLSGVKEVHWRVVAGCELDCSNGFTYNECGSSCPVTCTSALSTCGDESCLDGCHCPGGTLLHQNDCLTTAQCPCTFAGTEYAVGEFIQNDCNTCECMGKAWTCTDKICPAVCYATGDPHYITLDGKFYNFMGQCSYYLLYTANYKISAENVQCGKERSLAASCTRSVTINTNQTTVELKQRKEVIVNGVTLRVLPYKSQNVIVYEASSEMIKVYLQNGLEIFWDGKSRVNIQVPPSMKYNTAGLCGTYDGNQETDFKSKQGSYETSPANFGNAWKTDSSCPDVPDDPHPVPCEIYPKKKKVPTATLR